MTVRTQTRQPHVLVAIKLLHTVVWAFFVACILAIPVAGALHRFRAAGAFILLVLVECAMLAMNRGRCPLTDLARRYTAKRADNFDIYLPLWLARHNKAVFGTLFAAGVAYVLEQWMLWGR
jgi:hypothetical protein